MTLVMAYATLIGFCAALCAASLQALNRTRGGPIRWFWVLALVAVVSTSLAALVVPRPAGAPSPVATSVRLTPREAAGVDWIARVDMGLLAAWVLSSGVLLTLIGVSVGRVARQRRAAVPMRVHGVPVLATEQLGPAVSGLAKPVVLVPRWVLALDESTQQLLLAHEAEHLRAGDARLLWAAGVATALLPWNPAVWFIARRLRLAIEIDCDRRVLARSPNVRRYAELLFLAARRRGCADFASLAPLSSAATDLQRRIEAMTEPTVKPRLRLRVCQGAIALGSVIVACESPRPDPVAPISRSVAPVAQSAVEHTELSKLDRVRLKIGEDVGTLKFEPEELQASAAQIAAIRATVAKVDQASQRANWTEVNGKRLAYSVNVVRDTGAEAEVTKAATLDWVPSTEVTTRRLAYEVPREPGSTEARIVYRASEPQTDVPTVIVLSSEGRELQRFRPDVRSPLQDIQPEQIFSIEVLKRAACTGDCPQVRITLKQGSAYSPPRPPPPPPR